MLYALDTVCLHSLKHFFLAPAYYTSQFQSSCTGLRHLLCKGFEPGYCTTNGTTVKRVIRYTIPLFRHSDIRISGYFCFISSFISTTLLPERNDPLLCTLISFCVLAGFLGEKGGDLLFTLSRELRDQVRRPGDLCCIIYDLSAAHAPSAQLSGNVCERHRYCSY